MIEIDPPTCYADALVDAVWAQIEQDSKNQDLTAIYELLEQIDQGLLERFLLEDSLEELQEKWQNKG